MILAKGRAVGGIGGEKEQLGIAQAKAQAGHQENHAIQLRGKVEEAGRGLAGMGKQLPPRQYPR